MTVIPSITKFNAAKILPLLIATLAISSYASEPVESGAGQVCGTLKSFQGDIQVFDSTRTHLADAAFGTKLKCGDWVSIENGKAIIENTTGASLLVAGGTFLQILDPQSGENPEHAHFVLYRGEFYAQAESLIRITTPNSVAKVMKGGAFMIYSTSSETTQIVGLGAKASLENRFFSEKAIPTDFAKVVAFANPVERILPDEARPVNAKDINERLAKLGAKPELLAAVEKAVKSAVKTKMPVTLARTTIEIAPTGELASRSPASVAPNPTAMSPKPFLQKKAVKHVIKTESAPNFTLKRPASDEFEKQKLLQSLSAVRADEE